MIKIINKEDCCGCSACMSCCTHNAISMQPDALGFLYPVVDVNKCVDCGLCEKICAFNNIYDTSLNIYPPDVYGARHKNREHLETSRSGAAFIAISDWILEHGGVVYGAGYMDHFRVAHKRATTKDERDEFKGSKYVQSDMGNIYRQVKEDLKNGLIVLFSGTPCQTAGLNSYVGKNFRECLYLLDIVCHGVPSPSIWCDYLKYIERNKKGRIIQVNFRDKQYGWLAHKETFIFENELKWTAPYKGSFTQFFHHNIMLRKSCGGCYYCNTMRPSDITLGDFWGWERTNPDANTDNKGLSLILCNTQKGKILFEKIKKDLFYFPAELKNVLQPNLMHSTSLDLKSDKFEKDYINYGFEYVYKKYGDHGLKNKCINIIEKLRYQVKSLLS